MVKLGDVVPDFSAQSSQGPVNWHADIAGKWVVLFSHPADYTPVCTTELGTVASLLPEFEKRSVSCYALSIDTVESHKGWIQDIEASRFAKGSKVSYPIIADEGGKIAHAYSMFDPLELDGKGNKLTARAVFIIKDKKLRAQLLYPASTGRSFAEVLRVIDSLQMTDDHSVATPVNWTPGASCMVLPTVSNEDARKKFDKGFKILDVPSGKGYLRMTPDPKTSVPAWRAFLPQVKMAAAALAGAVVGALVARRTEQEL
ncbi:unnamed protein product [Pedinophyceae sp. YPF-701]|nr:unnamed protein product [Pedinophyceae sp. YPF-701]